MLNLQMRLAKGGKQTQDYGLGEPLLVSLQELHFGGKMVFWFSLGYRKL